ncbi:MAG: Outer membrane protein OprM [Chlamydiae bacterium]|nr:Outer membrane protein OprM [Chlamydiota bacterium]
MRHTFLTLFISLLLVESCVQIPTDEACCMLLSTPSIEESVLAALEGPEFVEGDFPPCEWWEMFSDPKLSQLICIALANNPTMQKVEALFTRVEEEAKIKRSHLFPTLGFNAAVNWRYLSENDFFRAFTPVIPTSIPEYLIDLDFSYEFDFWGKNRNIYEGALGLAKAQEAEKEGAILALSTSVATLYFKLQSEMQALSILKKERSLLTRLFELTQSREKEAIDDLTQPLQAEERLLYINQSILFSELQVTITKHALSVLLGEGPECDLEICPHQSPNTGAFPLPKCLSSNLLARRPDLMAQLWRVEAAAHLVGAAKAEFFPNISLIALTGFDSVFFNKLFSGGSFGATVRPALHLPIFTAGRIKANLGAKQAEFDEAIFTYNGLLLEAVKEVADKIANLQTADEALKITQRVVNNQTQQQQLTAKRYAFAVDNLLSLISAQEEVLSRELDQNQKEYEKRLAAVDLIKALGGGYCNGEQPL